MEITDLNADVLDHVSSYLNLASRVRLSSVCRHINECTAHATFEWLGVMKKCLDEINSIEYTIEERPHFVFDMSKFAFVAKGTDTASVRKYEGRISVAIHRHSVQTIDPHSCSMRTPFYWLSTTQFLTNAPREQLEYHGPYDDDNGKHVGKCDSFWHTDTQFRDDGGACGGDWCTTPTACRCCLRKCRTFAQTYEPGSDGYDHLSLISGITTAIGEIENFEGHYPGEYLLWQR